MSTDRIKDLLARGLSTLFLPPFILTWSMLWVLFSRSRANETITITLLVLFILGVIIPVSFFVYMVKKNKIADQDARNRTERHTPYIVGIALTILGQLIFMNAAAPADVQVVWLNYLTGTVFIFLVNLKWKISAHLMSNAIGVMPLVLFGLLPWYAALVLLLAIAWARLRLKCHTIMQVIAGALSGIIIALIIYRVMIG